MRPVIHKNMAAIQTQTRFAPMCLIALLLCAGLLTAGCDKAGVVPQDKKPETAGPGQGKNKSQGGGVDDMSVVPAPAGVKTGIEGGRK